MRFKLNFFRIEKLKKELNKNEYDSFGIALTEWQRGQSFEMFCVKALQIAGKKRIHILLGILNRLLLL